MLAVIGGTGLNTLPGLASSEDQLLSTPYGEVTLQRGSWGGQPLLFLPRHGRGHRVPPHRVAYRANLDALRQAGATRVIGVAAVGGMRPHLGPGVLVLPHDLIDYTWGRAHSFCDGESDQVLHIEFAPPYDPALCAALITAAQASGTPLVTEAVHAITQGPRLETAAEITRLQRDGGDIVGMTGMPEAALAREAGLAYASLAVVVNWAAGIGTGAIHAEIEQSLSTGMAKVLAVLQALPSAAA